MILTSRALLICFFFLIVSSFSSVALSADEKLIIDPQLFDHKQADRIILVTYADSHINRISVGSISQQYYRRRGEYDSSTWSKRIASNIEHEYRLKILSQWPIKEIGEHCVVYLISENHSISEIISSLSKDNRVGNVQSMGTFTIMANNFTDTYYRLQSNIHGINLDKIHDQTTGKNISIAIVDTGVDAKHPDLEGQIQVRKDFVTQKSSDLTADIHGTAVAGVIAAKANNGEGIVGIAPDSRITSLKACWQLKPGNMDAVCNTFTLALAINTAIEMKVNILNLSLTGPHDPLLARLIQKAVQEGIIVIASEADKNDSKSGFPARQSGVIGVSSIKSHSLHSTLGDNLIFSVSAPGNEILTTLPNGTYDFVSGNSLATAHVSGLAALLLQKNGKLSNQDIFNFLVKANEPTFYKVFLKRKLKNPIVLSENNY